MGIRLRSFLGHGGTRSFSLAALARLVLDEVALYNGEEVMAILWDMASFYDTIAWPVLVDNCVELGYPGQLLALGALAHLAPRLLRCSGTVSEPIPTTTGVAAGCVQATTFTKGFLFFVVDEAHRRYRPAQLSTFKFPAPHLYR